MIISLIEILVKNVNTQKIEILA
jgi:hypothetical protein